VINNIGQQVARQDYEDEEESNVPTPRIKDFANGIDGLLQGISSSNANKFLEGSLAFIPSPFRVGVKEILSSIVGRPIVSQTTKASTPKSKQSNNRKREKISSKTEAPDLENDSEEQLYGIGTESE